MSLVSRGLADAHAHEMPLTFACPASVFYQNQNIKQLDVPTVSGSFGILPHHVPVLAVLKPGVVTVYEDDANTQKYFVSSGSLTVNDDSSVQVLAEEACKLEDIDVQAAKEGLNKAQHDNHSATDEVTKAETQIQLETFEALVKAAETGQ
jgi:F-type H+-transporting ATPase subunit delta